MFDAGITALSVCFPKTVRTNDYWREHHPQAIARFERKVASQVWEAPTPKTLFAEAMVPYLDDVFRGSVERRVLGAGETALTLEVGAAQRALRAAGLNGKELDCVLLTSLYPDQLHVGNGIYLAEALELTCPVWNTESACGSAVANLILATSMVESGRAERVLVVVSCTYSRTFAPESPMSWTSGDGAAALLVSRVRDGGVLGVKAVNSKETLGSFEWDVVPHPELRHRVTFSATREAGARIETASERLLPLCSHGAADAAGIAMRDVRFVALPSPTAWFDAFARKKLGLTPEQTLDIHPRFANIGPALTPASLYYGAKAGRFGAGDVVMLAALGSVSSAGAIVLRFGECAIADETD